MKKAIVIETLTFFDDEFDAEKLIERLLFIEQVEKGLQDVKENRVMNFETVKKNSLISGRRY